MPAGEESNWKEQTMKLIEEQKSTYFKQVSSDSKLAELPS